MIAYQDMLKRIDILDRMYSVETDNIRAQMIAKLTALEIGGWLEEFFDDQLLGYIDKVKPECHREMESEIGNIHNFSYKDLRKVIIKIVGIIRMSDIEKQTAKEKQLLSSILGQIKHERDRAAHTSVSVDTSILAPSVLKSNFITAYSNASVIFQLLQQQVN